MDDYLKDSTAEDREALYESLNEDLLQVFDEDLLGLDDEFKFPLSHEAENSSPGNSSIHFLEEIGRGGMKIIHKCEVVDTGEFIALARLRKDGDASQVERFMREAKIAQSLKHENIIEIFDYGISPLHGPYMAMKYFQGDTLADILQEISLGNEGFIDRFPLKRRLKIFKAITSAISYAHNQGIVHLDIKPENVLIDKDGKILIYDWGLARLLPEYETEENFSLASQSGVYIKGSPGYMAPEQIVKKEKTVATDIYQLGGLLYAVLFYRSPVEGIDVEEVLEKTVAGHLDIPDSAEDNDLVVLIKKALEVDPEDRFNNVLEMMSDFNKINATFIALEKRQKVLQQRQVANYLHEASKYRKQVDETKKQLLIITVCLALVLLGAFYLFSSDFFGQQSESHGVSSNGIVEELEIDAESSYLKTLKE